MPRKTAQGVDFHFVRLVVDTIDEGLGILFGLAVHLAAGGHELGHGAVGQQHEFLDEPVGLFRNLLVDAERFAVLVHFHLHFRPLETDGAGGKTLVAENQGQPVQFHQGFHLFFGKVGGRTAFQHLLGLFIGISPVGTNDGAAHPLVDDLPLRGDFKNGAEGQFLLVGAQGAKLVGELFRQHRDGPVHQIDRCAAFAGLLVHNRTRAHVPRNIGNVHTHFKIPVRKFLIGEGVVKVFRVGGVDGEGEGVPKVAAVLDIGSRNGVRNGIGGVFHLFFESIGEAVFGQDGVHLGVVVAGGAEHIGQIAVRGGFLARPAVHHHGYLHAAHGFQVTIGIVDTIHGIGTILVARQGAGEVAAGRGLEGGTAAHQREAFFIDDIDRNVVRHVAALHEHPGLRAHDVQHAYKGLSAALDNLFYRSFPHGARSGSGLGDGHADDIAIQRALRFTGLDMNISFQSFNDDIEGAFTRHLHLSFVFRNGFFLFFVFFEIFVYPITAFTSFCVHNNEIK